MNDKCHVRVSSATMRILESSVKPFESPNSLLSRLVGGPVRDKKMNCRFVVSSELRAYLSEHSREGESVSATIDRLIEGKING